MNDLEYWEECLSQSMDEHGLTASREQIRLIAQDMSSARESYGMAFYQPENPMINEVRDLEKKLMHERSLVHCSVCNGTGREIYNSGPWAVNATCYRCNGRGRHNP